MAKLTVKQIQHRARAMLEDASGELRWGEIHKAITTGDPETPSNTVTGALTALFRTDAQIVKVAKGTYQHRRLHEQQVAAAVDHEQDVVIEPVIVTTPAQEALALVEADFYDSFAVWLAEGAEEVTAAITLGGNVLKGKWGTPDVIGVLRPLHHDLLKLEPQIVAAEIKIDPGQPVVAFGQAIAYRLFSHKSYIVVPSKTSGDDLARLKALCSLHGVGLVTFTLDPAAPDYTVVVLPQQASPDVYYANQMLHRLLDHSKALFTKLFG